ncbi:MAG: cobalamin B12-binding domain-containing protein [Elusimicrobia bacterium]|nr:cobalamin B12-binding domain-containing protein [Elusimicrobiota bacterium]
MAQLAAALKDRHHEARILDGNVYEIPLRNYASIIRWADVVGINVMCSYAALNTELNLKFIKNLRPGLPVVMGGHHPTFQDGEWLNKGADAVVRREGEITFPELVDALAAGRDLNDVAGVSWRDEDGSIRRNPDRPFIQNLDDLPMPAWDLVDFSGYYLYLRKPGRSACVETGRGCEQRCTFCQVGPMWRNTHRFKSPERVIEEMRLLKRHNVTQVFIVDDNYGSSMDTARQAKIYEGMVRENFGFEWGGFFRHDYIRANRALMKDAAASGLKFACVGFESVDSADIRKFNKGNAGIAGTEFYEEDYRFLKALGVTVFGFLVVGYPGENHASSMKTLEDNRRFCDYPVVTLYKPLPGTAGYAKTRQERLLAKEMFYHDSFTVAVRGTRPILAAYNRFFLRYLADPLRLIRNLLDPRLRRVETAIIQWFIMGMLRANSQNIADFFWFLFKGRKSAEEEVIERLRKKYLSEENVLRLARRIEIMKNIKKIPGYIADNRQVKK